LRAEIHGSGVSAGATRGTCRSRSHKSLERLRVDRRAVGDVAEAMVRLGVNVVANRMDRAVAEGHVHANGVGTAKNTGSAPDRRILERTSRRGALNGKPPRAMDGVAGIADLIGVALAASPRDVVDWARVPPDVCVEKTPAELHELVDASRGIGRWR
jgi:hypothetical protein